METTPERTYTILGGDNQEYGPITAGQFHEWARDGRVNGQTQVRPANATAWCAASTQPELRAPAGSATIPPPVTPPAPAAASGPELDQRIRSGASWFYWIAGMSLINSILSASQSSWGFALGLGISRYTDYAFAGSPAVAVALSVVLAGVIAAFGYFSIQRHGWAFLIGMVLLLLDTGLAVLQEAWLSVAFHAWALASIFMAFRASRAAGK